ncbi:MAG: DNA gyrase inhibitor YacG [Thermoguttaceae bacterium]
MSLVRCPVCGKPFEPGQTPAMPFCSPRCRQIDLKRWLAEQYQVPGESRPGAGGREGPVEAPEPRSRGDS